jgi:hypothetical protein
MMFALVVGVRAERTSRRGRASPEATDPDAEPTEADVPRGGPGQPARTGGDDSLPPVDR